MLFFSFTFFFFFLFFFFFTGVLSPPFDVFKRGGAFFLEIGAKKTDKVRYEENEDDDERAEQRDARRGRVLRRLER
jgi:hypothetical protein